MQLFDDGLGFNVLDEQQKNIIYGEKCHEGQNKAFIKLHAAAFRASLSAFISRV